jgi:hypothetical protein
VKWEEYEKLDYLEDKLIKQEEIYFMQYVTNKGVLESETGD